MSARDMPAVGSLVTRARGGALRATRRHRAAYRAAQRLRFAAHWIADAWQGLPGSRGELIPPRRLRLVGGGDFTHIGENQVRKLVELGGLSRNDAVLDVGCGVGRVAIPLTRYLDEEATYAGFDIVPGWVRWCQANVTARHPGFEFQLVDVHNEKYNPRGALEASAFRFPYAASSFTFAFASSVFTHMPLAELDNYLAESSRVLRPGGRLLSTFFVLNDASHTEMSTGERRLSFRHERDGYWLEDPGLPELAIAYEEDVIRDLHRRHGLELVEPIHYGSWSGRAGASSYQDVVVARRAQSPQPPT